MKFIGIDLGTTFSVVTHINSDGKPQTIPTDSGFVTPSVIYFGEKEPIVGDEAKEQQAVGAFEIASFFKRHMGDPHFALEFRGKTYTPIDLSAIVLSHLKRLAEAYLGETVRHAVITVPAYFNNMQREATIEAGRLAGLEVLAIISEPTAAALAYGIRPNQGEQTVLVYDLGGGTFDISIVRITPTEQRVLGTDGDHNLGGKDWDDRIFTWLIQQFEDEYGTELVDEEFNELLVKAEQAKKSLSARQSVNIRVQADGKRGNYSLSRATFESLTADLMERTTALTERALDDIHLSWRDIDHVLLVGGSTRMPMVRDYVARMVGKPPLTTVNPDEAVSLGAAIQAAMEMETTGQLRPTFSLAGRKKTVDVISHSLGLIAVNDDHSRYINSIIIGKNQQIPSEQTRPYKLRLNRSGDNTLDVFMTQGETNSPADCAYLGKYVFSDIPHINAREAILDIMYTYDKNGVVHVSATERSTKKPLKLTIEPLPEDIPERFLRPPEVETIREHLTIYLAFDLSGSMSGAPLKAAQKAAHEFVRQCDLTTTSVGLISFSDNVLVEAEACQNAKTVGKAIDGLQIGRTGYGNRTHPFDEIHQRLKHLDGNRYAIVLADGVWANQSHAVKRAKNCHAKEIEIVGIGFGSADEEFLRQISSSDQNAIFTDMNNLTSTFGSIAQELTEGGTASKGLGRFFSK